MNIYFLSQFNMLNAMVKRNSNFILLLFCAFLLNACESDLEKCQDNPDCTYFVCKVNGEDWGINCEGDPLFGCTALDARYLKDIQALSIIANNIENNTTITFKGKSKLKIGNNSFFINEFINTRFADGNKNEPCIIFKLDTLVKSNFYISQLDTLNYKLEGTFFLECRNECGDVVNITDGKFRVGYRF